MFFDTLDLSTDTHVHTSFCNHAIGEMEDYVRAALDKGLKRLVFLEHMEVGIHRRERTWLDEAAFDLYHQEGERLQKAYAGAIKIELGVEAGYNREASDALLRELARYNWDRIGLSYHFYPHQGEFLNLLSANPKSLQSLAEIGPEQVLSDYFEALIEGARSINCNALCHLDAALRHLPDLRLTERHHLLIEELLEIMAARNIALEINTSGYAYRGFPFPAPWILGAAIRKDIRLDAGSDAHRPQDVGRYFELLPVYLERAARQPPPE